MDGTMKTGVICGLSAGVLLLSGIALALDPGGYPPGWEYGRLNCGPNATPPITTLEDCRACCENEYNNGWHTQT